MDPFLLKPFGIGRAVENKELSSKTCDLTIIELFAFSEGEIKSDKSDIGYTGPDASGVIKSTKIKFNKSIKAEWLPIGSNRKSAPDIRRGERVQVYRLGDTNRYFWKELGLDDDLRRLETVIFAISNCSDNNKAKLEASDFYFLEFSTHAKLITLKTSKSDGEPFEYLAQFDTKAGSFLIEDDTDNRIHLVSAERLLEFHNADKSFIRLEKKKLRMHADEEVEITTKRFKLNASESISTDTKTQTVNAQTYTATHTTYTMGSTNATMNTKVTINGLATLASGLGVSGGASVAGSLTNNGVNVGNDHTHPHGIPRTGTPS